MKQPNPTGRPASTPPSPPAPDGDDAAVRRDLTRKSFLGLGWTGLAGLAAYGAWKWLVTRPLEEGRAGRCDESWNSNSTIARATFRRGALAPEFPDRAPGRSASTAATA